MLIPPEIEGCSIVFLGSFNPAIFHPAWFAANGILTEDEAKKANVEIIHREIAIFKIPDWLFIHVTPNRFIAETQEPPPIRLLDLVFKTFGEALVHTPLAQMGINRQVHFSVGDIEVRDRIGKVLAPQNAWGEWEPRIAGRSREKRGGMMSLVMIQRDLDDRESGHIQAKVEPSPKITNQSGILVEVNDHYEFKDKDVSGKGTERMISLLQDRFEKSMEQSAWIIDQIMALKDKV